MYKRQSTPKDKPLKRDLVIHHYHTEAHHIHHGNICSNSSSVCQGATAEKPAKPMEGTPYTKGSCHIAVDYLWVVGPKDKRKHNDLKKFAYGKTNIDILNKPKS